MFQNKDKLIFIYVLYQIVKYLSIFFMNYFCIFYIVSHAIFLCIIFIRKACFPGRFPLSERLVSFPCKLSLRLGCRAKYKLISQRALADFARGAFATPLWTPGFWIPGTVSLFAFGLQSHVPAMPMPCPRYAHAMPTVCPCHAHIICYFVDMALLPCRIKNTGIVLSTGGERTEQVQGKGTEG